MTTNSELWHESFNNRAQAVFYGRMCLYGLFLVHLIFLYWNTPGKIIFDASALFLGLALSYFSFTNANHPQFGRWLIFVSLFFDVLFHLYLSGANGFITSPLFAVHPFFTATFLLLFHNPKMMALPLLMLPLATGLSLTAEHGPLSSILFLVVLYSLLDACAIFFVHLTLSKEQDLTHALKALEVVKERQRIAREFHDGVGASLTSIAMQCEYLVSAPLAPSEMAQELADIRIVALESIDDMRRSIALLTNSFEITEQLVFMCQNIEKRHRLNITVQNLDNLKNLTKDQQIATCRIVQEALHNVLKHAKATLVGVQSIKHPDGVFLVVKDNGVGFDIGQNKPLSFGLKNMQERAAKMGGLLNVTSQKNLGTTVELFFS